MMRYELEHQGEEGEETRSGYTKEEDVSRLPFESLTAQYDGNND